MLKFSTRHRIKSKEKVVQRMLDIELSVLLDGLSRHRLLIVSFPNYGVNQSVWDEAKEILKDMLDLLVCRVLFGVEIF